MFGLLASILFETMLCKAEETTIKEPDNLYALSACLMDAETGRVLFSKNGEEERAMASTTKIMTLLVVLENANLDSVVTISSNAARQPDVQLNINTGERYYLKDLLYSLMLESHNDAAVAIAEGVSGSVEAFAGLMNEKANELGLSKTHFVTPNGLDSEDTGGKHRTTAIELAKLLSYCITESPHQETFLEITRTASYTFSDLEGKRTFTCNNHNAFLGMMEGALTGKTGFTSEAGYCYVGALQREGKTFVVALLGCGWPNNKSYKWKDTRKLMEYGLLNYERKALEELPKNQEVLARVPVINGQSKNYGKPAVVELQLRKEENGNLFQGKEALLLRKDEELYWTLEIPESLQAPIKAGTVVGKICYYINKTEVTEDEILVKNTVLKIDFSWCLGQILQKFLL